MPLHINLLHEEQAKLVERKRDPLKIGLLCLLVIGLGLYGYYLTRSFKSARIQRELSGLQAELALLEPKATEAQRLETEAQQVITTAGSLEKIINDRFYWGPFLAELIRSTSPDIQINRLDADFKDVTSSLNVTMEGLSSGVEPRAAAERFRQRMTDTFIKSMGPTESQFNSLDDNAAKVTLQNKLYGTAVFTIEFVIKLQPRKPDEKVQ